MTLDEALAALAALEDPKMRAANEKRGDDHGMKLSHLRTLAARIKKDHALAEQLWATGQTPARLLTLLICDPAAFSADELDRMVREPQPPKVYDWFVNYVVKKSPVAEELRLRWLGDPDDTVAGAAWALTAMRVSRPDDLDLDALLDEIQSDMAQATPRTQWAMNETLAQIGIRHPHLRDRAISIGNALQVLADYPTAPGCVSPFAPVWITEMVRRQG